MRLDRLAAAATALLWTLAGILWAAPLFHGYRIPQANGLCASGAGQIVQALNGHARDECQLAAGADHIIGILVAAGAAALAAGAAWRLRRAVLTGPGPWSSHQHCGECGGRGRLVDVLAHDHPQSPRPR